VILLPLLLLTLTSPRAPACDGIPPELVNEDSSAHSYTLSCGKKDKKREIAPGEKAELEGFSGCTLKLGDHSETLHTEMVCTIQAGGKLVCDLL
jgi:hypothetical protein